jgi:hypothetical protein
MTTFSDKLRQLHEAAPSKQLSTSIRHGGAPIYGLEPHGSGCATLVKHQEDAELICLLRNHAEQLLELLRTIDTYLNKDGSLMELDRAYEKLNQAHGNNVTGKAGET